MSPRGHEAGTSMAGSTCSPTILLARNCLVVCFRKVDSAGKDVVPFIDDVHVGHGHGNGHCEPIPRPSRVGSRWSSSAEDYNGQSRPLSPGESVLSYPTSLEDQDCSVRCTCDVQVDGWTLFSDFIRLNSSSFWSSTLAGSVASLEFKGYLLPASLLIGGSDYALDMIRSSWTRRMLKPPTGYIIDSLGKFSSFVFSRSLSLSFFKTRIVYSHSKSLK